MREMFALQPRLEHPRGRRALRVIEHPRFRAAYDLLLLRAEFGMALGRDRPLVDPVQEVSSEERGRMADALTGQALSARKVRRAGAAAVAVAGVVVPRIRADGMLTACVVYDDRFHRARSQIHRR